MGSTASLPTFKDGTYRDDFSFKNSPETVLRAPFPFDKDEYMYAVNMELHKDGRKGTAYEQPIDMDEHYLAEMRDRALVLDEDPLRCQSLPHMEMAGWDTLELLMECKAASFPDAFTLERDGDQWHWINRPMGIDQRFTFGDATTLPYGPLEYITRQAQGDFVVLDERDGNLWMDAGIVTTQADWSLDFDIGMNFFEWHAPVPLAHEKGIFQRALKYLLAVQQSNPARRLNWTMTVNPRLDTSPENYHQWGPENTHITPDNVADKLFLRIELQSFWRLPRSNAILFPIRCYLLSMRDLSTVPKWATRMHRVLKTLPPELSSYKGLDNFREIAIDWLSEYDDGSPTTPGPFPD